MDKLTLIPYQISMKGLLNLSHTHFSKLLVHFHHLLQAVCQVVYFHNVLWHFCNSILHLPKSSMNHYLIQTILLYYNLNIISKFNVINLGRNHVHLTARLGFINQYLWLEIQGNVTGQRNQALWLRYPKSSVTFPFS